MALTARGITKRFGGVTALNGVDLDLADGEVLGLIGPNGSGKTTLINCLSGVLEADAGEVSLNGTDLSRRSRAFRAKQGMARTFQTPRLFDALTVRENVAVGLNSAAGRNGGAESVDHWMRRLNLTGLAREVVANLSYGDQRRVEIARALAGAPSVLLLDEPAAGLNDVETEQLRELLRELQREHRCSVVVIDHDMRLILEVSDRVQVLDEGKVIFVGSPSEVFKQRHVVEAYLGAE